MRVQRATRGKALRFNFGASIHRVIGLDIADAVFEPGTTEMRAQWQPRMSLLLEELQKGPAVLRLSYLADVEDERLVDAARGSGEETKSCSRGRRSMSWLSNAASAGAQELPNCCYQLTIEPEVFWRRGAPVTRVAEASRHARAHEQVNG